MRSHIEQAEIDAPADEVWKALVDFGAYPRWNRTIPRAEGAVAVGARLSLQLELGTESRAFDPEVLEVRPGALLLLQKVLLHRVLLRATHAFRLDSLGGDRTRLTQEWQLDGVLAGAVWPRFRLGLPAFARMGGDLAREVERRRARA